MLVLFLNTSNFHLPILQVHMYLFNYVHFSFSCLAENEAVKVRLDNRDVRECLGCTHHKLPVLFFRANESFGKKVRTALKMVDPEQDPYYDPDSKSKWLASIVSSGELWLWIIISLISHFISHD